MGRELWLIDWRTVNSPLGLPGQSLAVCRRTSFEPLKEGLPGKPDEIHYYVSSVEPGRFTRQRLEQIIRGHWRIENFLHHVKDRTWLEDRHWLKNPRAAVNCSMLRSLAAGIVRNAKGKAMKSRPHCPARTEYFRRRPMAGVRLMTTSKGL